MKYLFILRSVKIRLIIKALSFYFNCNEFATLISRTFWNNKREVAIITSVDGNVTNAATLHPFAKYEKARDIFSTYTFDRYLIKQLGIIFGEY